MDAKYPVVTNLFVEMKSLGEVVRELRKKRGWSQTELANRVGVKAQNIQQLEDGSVKSPRYLINLAKAFGLSVEEIYRLAGTSPGEKSNLKLPDDTLRLARILADCEPEKYRAIELIADAPADKVRAILVLLGAREEEIRRLQRRQPAPHAAEEGVRRTATPEPPPQEEQEDDPAQEPHPYVFFPEEKRIRRRPSQKKKKKRGPDGI